MEVFEWLVNQTWNSGLSAVRDITGVRTRVPSISMIAPFPEPDVALFTLYPLEVDVWMARRGSTNLQIEAPIISK